MGKIQLENISKYFGKFAAVDSVNLEINDGEFVTILGPSGSGKTTLLTLIAGFEDPTLGKILINGTDVIGLPPEKRNIGLLFQSYALFPHMTVYENIAFPLNVRKVPKQEIKGKVKDALSKVRLNEYGDRKISELSGGQQQRVALARSFVFEPSILLLDEPMSALDRKLRQDLQIEMRKLHESLGITTISVTHDQEEALTMSDRILILNHGKIEQFGTPAELYGKPANKFVAGFLGTANFFDGTVKLENNGKEIFVSDSGHQIEMENSGLGHGEQACLLVRPENIKMNYVSEGAKDGIRGKIQAVIYLGSNSKYQVEIDEGQEILVNHQGLTHFREGEEVLLHWDSKDNWFIPETSNQDCVSQTALKTKVM